MQEFWRECGAEFGLDINSGGIPGLSHFSFGGEDSLKKITIYVEHMLRAGILAGGRYYPNFAQTEDDFDLYCTHARQTFKLISDVDDGPALDNLLSGGVARPGFSRLT